MKIKERWAKFREYPKRLLSPERKLWGEYEEEREVRSVTHQLATEHDEIWQTLRNLERCRSNFLYAEKDYIDIAVFEIYNEEIRLSIQLKKLKLLYKSQGVDDPGTLIFPSREHLPWMKQYSAKLGYARR